MTRRTLAADDLLSLGVDDLHREDHLLFLIHLRLLVGSLLHNSFHNLPPFQYSLIYVLFQYFQTVLFTSLR